jgi:hypothetical protein
VVSGVALVAVIKAMMSRAIEKDLGAGKQSSWGRQESVCGAHPD